MALSQLICLILIRWIENYPMNSAIRRLNKPGLGSFLRSCRFFLGGGGGGMGGGGGGGVVYRVAYNSHRSVSVQKTQVALSSII